MKAYKLFRIRKDGTIGSLFINRSAVYPTGVWMMAEPHQTPGFAPRTGWHCLFSPVAPHLKLKPASGEKRVWYEVKIRNYAVSIRPASQGGRWFLAHEIKIIGVAKPYPSTFNEDDPRAVL